MKTDYKHIDISNFLPHRKPMLMVSLVLAMDKNTITTQFDISNECLFLENGVLSETGLIENVAQSSSGVVGRSYFENDDIEGKGTKLVGYISSIKKIEIFGRPKVSQSIITKANLISRFDTAGVTRCGISAEIFLEKKLIVSSSMNFLIHEV